MDSGAGREFEYRLRLCLPDGRTVKTVLQTRRLREVGEMVNLPTGPDGSSRIGSGFIWRITTVEDDGATLLLDYVRPNQCD